MRLFDYFDYQAKINPHKYAISCGDSRITFLEARQQSLQLAKALVNLGMELGDRAVFLSKNCTELLLFITAASRVGVVTIPLNTALSIDERSKIILDSSCKLLVCTDEYRAQIDSLIDTHPHLTFKISLNGKSVAGWMNFNELIEPIYDINVCVLSRFIKPSDIAYQLYTTGTTDTPKGVPISHANISSALHQLCFTNPKFFDCGSWLIATPIASAATALSCFLALSVGAKLYIHADFDREQFLATIESERITCITLFSTTLESIVTGEYSLKACGYSNLKLVLYGGVSVTKEMLFSAMDLFKTDFCELYSTTEASGAITMLCPDDHEIEHCFSGRTTKSVGKAILGTHVSIRDGNGNALPVGSVGEIAVMGGQITTGYWNLPDADIKALRGGWLFTGDTGYLDEAGYLYIVERI